MALLNWRRCRELMRSALAPGLEAEGLQVREQNDGSFSIGPLITETTLPPEPGYVLQSVPDESVGGWMYDYIREIAYVPLPHDSPMFPAWVVVYEVYEDGTLIEYGYGKQVPWNDAVDASPRRTYAAIGFCLNGGRTL